MKGGEGLMSKKTFVFAAAFVVIAVLASALMPLLGATSVSAQYDARVLSCFNTATAQARANSADGTLTLYFDSAATAAWRTLVNTGPAFWQKYLICSTSATTYEILFVTRTFYVKKAEVQVVPRQYSDFQQ